MPQTPKARAALLGMLCVALVVSSLLTQLRFNLRGENPVATLEQLTEGTAMRPFQYRALVPWIAAAASRTGTVEARTVYGMVELGSLLMLWIALAWYLGHFVRDRTRAAALALLVYYVIPFQYLLPVFIRAFYPSDIPAIWLFTLGLGALYRQSWRAYYPLFAVATLNRETSCFLTVGQVITSWGREPRRQIAAHATAQLAIWVALKTFLWRLYRGNGGRVFELTHRLARYRSHFMTNLSMLGKPAVLPTLLSALGFTWIAIPFGYRRIDEPFVRRLTWLMPLLLAGMFVVANIQEIRIYNELIPIALPAFLLISLSWLGVPAEPPRVDPE